MADTSNTADSADTRGDNRRVRLQPTRELSVAPWIKSREQLGCHLYWMPFRMPDNAPRQREWVLAFAERLGAELAALRSSEPYFFLQMKVINDFLSAPFYSNSRKLSPMLGLSRRPGAALPALPDARYIEDLQKGRIQYDHKAIQPDFCFYFLFQDMPLCLSQFLGVGGSTTLFLPPDKRAQPVPPPIPYVVQHDPAFRPLLEFARPDDMAGALHRMQSPAFPRSRRLFGRGLEEDVQARNASFIVPLLSISSFQQASPADLEEWFGFFDVVLTESPEDKGLLLASRPDLDLDPVLDRLAETLREELRLEYPLYV